MTDITMEDGLLGARPPKPTLQIGMGKVLTAIVVIGLLFTVGIVIGKGPKTPKTQESNSQIGQPGYNVSALPSTYAELPVPTPLARLAREPLQSAPKPSNLEAYLLKLAEESLRRAQSAKAAPVSFQHLSLPKEDPASQNSDFDLKGDLPENKLSMNPRDDANRQDDKTNFLNKKTDAAFILKSRIISQKSPYQLSAGTLIPGLLLTGLNSDLPGQILGQVSQNVYDSTSGKYLLVPQGTKVLGQYDSRIVYGQERVLIVWTRLVFPNGKSISLEGMPGVDLSGYAGLSDQVNNHWGRLLSGVIFSSLLSAGAQVAEGRTYSTQDPSYAELAGQGVAKNANDVGQEITRKNLNIQPTLEIRQGFRFNVFVHKDMILESYRN